jgi:Na+/H+ antiporter NhaC
MDYGYWVVLPPLVAIVLCFITKQVVVSLFVGILTGGMIMCGGNPVAGLEYSLNTLVGSIADEWNATILLFTLLMGSGIAFIWKLGGSRAMADWAMKKIKTRRGVGIGTYLLGLLIFFNDGVNTAIVGNVFRDVAKAKRVSTEKLSYLLDSTAAPVATFFISDWIAFQVGMIQSGLDGAGITSISAFEGYLKSVPLNLYCILTVIFVGFIAFTGRDFGPMRKAEQRARTTGDLVRADGQPMMDVGSELGEPLDVKPLLLNMVLPIVVLIAVAMFGFYWTGREGTTLMEILGNSDPSKALFWGAFAMTLTGIVLALGQKLMGFKEAMDTMMEGFKLMLIASFILILAWTMGTVTKDMKLADFLITLIGDNVSYAYVPAIIFVLGMLISFGTGTSWGTMTILTPIAIPLAYQMTGSVDAAMAMAGVVFSGAIFGDHCSPISDTTVLSSIFSGADHMDHVSTQVPYAATVAGVTFLMLLAYGFFQTSPLVLIGVGTLLLAGVLYGLSAGPVREQLPLEAETESIS